MGVDSHAHVMSNQLPLVAGRHSEPHVTVSADDFLHLLDQHGIGFGVLTQPSFYGDDNSMLLDALGRHPDRLRGTAIVGPGVSDADLHDLAARGVAGVRLNWFKRDRLPDIRPYERLLGQLADHGMHVEVYVEGRNLPALMPTILASGAVLVLDHFAAPDPQLRTACPGFRAALAAVEGGRCYVKLSAPYRLGGAPAQPYVDVLLAAGGADRLVWGSDWPWVSNAQGRDYGELLGLLDQWVPDDADRDAILTVTPMALFGFPAAQRERASTGR